MKMEMISSFRRIQVEITKCSVVVYKYGNKSNGKSIDDNYQVHYVMKIMAWVILITIILIMIIKDK